MPSTTSLLRSAASTRNKIRNYEDSVAAFEWNLSAKTQDDYANYLDYLQRRAGEESDPSKTLSYQRTMVGAQRSFVSHEIQRSTIDILEGRGTSSEKYTKMVGLYQLAISNQDLDLAQSLRSQLDSLDIKIQNEMESAQRVAGTMARNGIKARNDAAEKMLDLYRNSDEPIETPDGPIKSVKMIEEEFRNKGETQFGVFSELEANMKEQYQFIAEAQNGITTSEEALAFEKKHKAFFDGTAFSTVMGKKFTYQDIVVAKQSAQANNPLYTPQSSYNPATGQTEWSLSENKVDDVIWAYGEDEQGNLGYRAVQVRRPDTIAGQDLSMKIKIGDTEYTVKERLAQLGFGDAQERDGEILINVPGLGNVKASIMPDGSVRYIGQPGQFSGEGPGIYEINTVGKDPETLREVAPDETSDFGVKSPFGGFVSQQTESGKRLISQLAGLTTTPTELLDMSRVSKLSVDSSDRTGNFLPIVGSNIQGGTSGLLGQAGMVRSGIQRQEELNNIRLQAESQAAQQLQARNSALQANVGSSLQQTLVRDQSALSGRGVKLPVVNLPATPKVNVVQPQVRQTPINVGTGFVNQKKVSVGTAPVFGGRISF